MPVYYAMQASDGTLFSPGVLHAATDNSILSGMTNAVALTADQFTQVNSQDQQYKLVSGALVGTGVVPGPSLAQRKTQAIAQVNVAAEQARCQFITPGSGQALAYQEKYTEASAFLAAFPTDASASGVDLTPYPLISAEVGLTASDAFGVATVFVTKKQAWKAVAATIESTRLTAKAAILTATTTAGIHTVIAGITWPTSTSAPD